MDFGIHKRVSYVLLFFFDEKIFFIKICQIALGNAEMPMYGQRIWGCNAGTVFRHMLLNCRQSGKKLGIDYFKASGKITTGSRSRR